MLRRGFFAHCLYGEENPIRYLVLLTALLFPLTTFGHVPVFPERDTTIEHPLILQRPYEQSIAIYTYFESDEDVDVYEFEVLPQDFTDSSLDILIGTLVPACLPLQDLLISWILIGPKQEALSDNIETAFLEKFGVSDQEGVLFTTNNIQGEVWEEPYTAHYYFRQIRRKLTLTRQGAYRIFVWSNTGRKGDYVLEFGDKEIWPLKDILHTIWVYPKLLFEQEIVTEGCVTSDMK